MVTGKAWTDEEIKIICMAYARMLAAELKGEKYNKSAVRRANVPLLDGRSEGSWEMKCCNISAALEAKQLPRIEGYLPRAGYQKSLEQAAAAALAEHGIK